MKRFAQCLMANITAGAAGLTVQLQAQAVNPPPTYVPPPAYNPPPPNANYTDNGAFTFSDYHAQEFSVDLFGAGTTGTERYDHFSGYHLHHDAHGGGGVGINYFFCRYVGVGADTLTEGLDPFIYSASGNVIGRFPIGDTGLAPYVFGGGGYQFHNDREGFGQAGAGLEYRFARHLGVFVDGRGVIPGERRDYGLFRGGLRVSF